MTSAKLEPPTKSAATSRINVAEQVESAASENSIKELDSFFDTLPGWTSDDPFQSRLRSLHDGNLRAAFRVG
jgi:hypothetical protein